MPKRAAKPEPDYGNMTLAELEKLLNLRQRKYVLHLVSGMSQTDAAIAAGYSPKTAASQASDLLKIPKILAYRRALTCAVLERACLTPESIAINLFGIYTRCMQAMPVEIWDYEQRCYVKTGEFQFDSRGAIRVMELLGKNLGMFKDRVEHSSASTFLIDSGSLDTMAKRGA